ncbi:hypothetical protein BSPA14S_H0019 (plasmid) [Borreliella spielmanii A14S]|uniref:Uncharacterized protein n=1 Tax=Borreliella spielmanii A14S TaxID=498742 RepID=C0RCE5_9SPIR|nr:hypothetical protein BSPA14S_H0019 [Borreliella spielmanii A14S]
MIDFLALHYLLKSTSLILISTPNTSFILSLVLLLFLTSKHSTATEM